MGRTTTRGGYATAISNVGVFNECTPKREKTQRMRGTGDLKIPKGRLRCGSNETGADPLETPCLRLKEGGRKKNGQGPVNKTGKNVSRTRRSNTEWGKTWQAASDGGGWGDK